MTGETDCTHSCNLRGELLKPRKMIRTVEMKLFFLKSMKRFRMKALLMLEYCLDLAVTRFFLHYKKNGGIRFSTLKIAT